MWHFDFRSVFFLSLETDHVRKHSNPKDYLKTNNVEKLSSF